MQVEQNEKARDSRLRKQALRQGFALKRSRDRTTHADNWGGYMITIPYNNSIAAGERFDMSADDVERFLADEQVAAA